MFFLIFSRYIHGNAKLDFHQLIGKFFSTLFPVAYHRAVHTSESGAGTFAGDFHGDYKNCLRHAYQELQPFGNIPHTLANNLQHSLGKANVFIEALVRASDILASTEDITAESLSPKCRQHLLKITYCSKCQAVEAKSCYGYCTNVLR